MKQFPFDRRYEISDAQQQVAYYIDGDSYIRTADAVPVYRIDGINVYTYGEPGEHVGFLEGARITDFDAEDMLLIQTES